MEWLASLIAVIGGLYAGGRFIFRMYRKRKTPIKENEIYSLVDRFIALLKAHGIERTQIHRFLGEQYNLTLADVSTNEKLLPRLDETVLSSACETFGIQREWLDRGDTPVYDHLSFYKNMNRYVDFLSEITKKYEEVQGFAIKSPEDKLKKNGKDLSIALLFRMSIGVLGDNQIYKYIVTNDTWFWGYGRTRIQLKAMVFAALQFSVFIAGCELPQKDIADLLEGKVFPGPLLGNLSWVQWRPDDYIYSSDESPVSADSEEALMAREYMSDTGWMQKLRDLSGKPGLG